MDAVWPPDDRDVGVYGLADLCAGRSDRRILPILPYLRFDHIYTLLALPNLGFPETTRFKLNPNFT